MQSKAEQYANKVLRENYGDMDWDEDDLTIDMAKEDPTRTIEAGLDMDDKMEGIVRLRDVKAWLEQGFEAGYAAGQHDATHTADDCARIGSDRCKQ
jgi:hypothetical protein